MNILLVLVSSGLDAPITERVAAKTLRRLFKKHQQEKLYKLSHLKGSDRDDHRGIGSLNFNHFTIAELM